jgi:hypothetical protein
VAKASSSSPLSTTNGVDKLYCQLAEIHTITAMQLAECAQWRDSDSTPSPVGWGLAGCLPRQAWLHHHRLTSPPKPCGSGEAHMLSPWRTGGPVRWMRNLSSVCGTRTMVSPAAGGNTAMTLRGQGLRCLEVACAMCH